MKMQKYIQNRRGEEEEKDSPFYSERERDGDEVWKRGEKRRRMRSGEDTGNELPDVSSVTRLAYSHYNEEPECVDRSGHTVLLIFGDLDVFYLT